MKRLCIIFTIIIASLVINAQEKYAVIVNRYNPSGTTDSINMYQTSTNIDDLSFEFWNDLYLMWEMLYERGFDDENIYVFYDQGHDFEYPDYNSRYTAEYHDLAQITDYRAYRETFDSLFYGLATGANGFTQIKEDDFLVIYFFGHGGSSGYTLFPLELESSGYLYWSDFAEKLDSINCHKKLIIMQQCKSGGSIQYLQDTNTIIMTAVPDSLKATRIDGHYYDGIDYPGDTLPGNRYDAYEFDRYPSDTLQYNHGEFDFHLFNAIRRIDPGNQSVYYQTDTMDFPLSNADSNEDGFTSMSEAFSWIRTYDSRMMDLSLVDLEDWDDPQLSDSSNISSTTSIEYPTLIFSDIGSTQMHRGIIGVSKTIHVTYGNQLRLHDNALVDLVNGSNIVVDDGATLIIGKNVTINGNLNSIIIDGEIHIGNNVEFNYTGIEINKKTHQTSIDSITLNHSVIYNSGVSLTINNSNFIDSSQVFSYRGNIDISNSIFTNSMIHLENQGSIEENTTATVYNCEFTSAMEVGAIDIWNYNNFLIDSNTIDGYFNGIQIMQSGEGASGNQNIFENEIFNCENAGILSFNSTSSIAGNHIYNNYCGIRLFNNSNTDICGNAGATTKEETQQISDNDSYEIYASSGSFPWYIHYNVIEDSANLGNPYDPIIYYSGPSSLNDVRYNCWGSNFDPLDDLYPSGYIVNPTWCPGASKSASGPAETLYLAGKSQYDSADYVTAKGTFELVISQYPESEYASASMKDLFTIEKYVDNDYISLQTYFNTNTIIQSDSILQVLSVFLANKCDVELENWTPAISHYEDIINNPLTPDDSIFAIIDLGHVYFLIENSNNRGASIVGSMPEYKPKSKTEFIEKREHLLSLLPFEKKQLDINDIDYNENILLQNIPNPFSNTTTISFNLTNQCQGSINVINNIGEIVRTISFTKGSGMHNIILDVSDQPVGIYYYSLVINGKRTDTKKMVLIN